MTKEQAQEIADLYQAVADGKRIQWRYGSTGPWSSIADIADIPVNVEASYGEHRIEPEPMEYWVNIRTDGLQEFHLTKEAADKEPAKRERCVHLREVMDE